MNINQMRNAIQRGTREQQRVYAYWQSMVSEENAVKLGYYSFVDDKEYNRIKAEIGVNGIMPQITREGIK